MDDQGSFNVIDLRTREVLRPLPDAEEGVRDPLRTLRALRALLREPGDLVPDDVLVLERLLGAAAPLRGSELRAEIDEIVLRGQLRRLFLGRESHLALPRPASPSEEPPRAAGSPTPADASLPAADQQAADALTVGTDDGIEAASTTELTFQTRLMIDVETERVLMYRVSIIIVAIVALVLARTIGLDLLGY